VLTPHTGCDGYTREKGRGYKPRVCSSHLEFLLAVRELTITQTDMTQRLARSAQSVCKIQIRPSQQWKESGKNNWQLKSTYSHRTLPFTLFENKHPQQVRSTN
jgi:hypothetical protein